jgi:hypothetical protein
MDSRARARVAAATGILFVVALAAGGIIMEMKDFERPGDLALQASNEVFGTVTLLTGFAAGFFFWFASTLAARIRELEGGSGRLAAAVNGSGAIIAGVLALSTSVSFAARSTGSADLAALTTGILDGPVLFFPAAVFLAAGSVVTLRTPSVPVYSMWTARLILPLAFAYGAGAGLQLFKNYAWINETAYISFLIVILVVSIIGIQRWGEMDAEAPREGRPTRRGVAASPQPEPPTVASPARKARPRRKAAPRKR